MQQFSGPRVCSLYFLCVCSLFVYISAHFVLCLPPLSSLFYDRRIEFVVSQCPPPTILHKIRRRKKMQKSNKKTKQNKTNNTRSGVVAMLVPQGSNTFGGNLPTFPEDTQNTKHKKPKAKTKASPPSTLGGHTQSTTTHFSPNTRNKNEKTGIPHPTHLIGERSAHTHI